jgi:hypothetical protein
MLGFFGLSALAEESAYLRLLFFIVGIPIESTLRLRCVVLFVGWWRTQFEPLLQYGMAFALIRPTRSSLWLLFFGLLVFLLWLFRV